MNSDLEPLRPRHSRHFSPQFSTKPTVTCFKTVISYLKGIGHRRAAVLGWILYLMIASHQAQAIETIVVYGQRVPVGFYNLTVSLMSPSDLQGLYTQAGGPHTGGIPPVQMEVIKWHSRCGNKLRILYDTRDACLSSVRSFYDGMLDSCDAISSGRSVDITVHAGHKYLGGSLTWTAPTHTYSYCRDKAANRRDGLIDECGGGFENAKMQDSACQGASGWDPL